MAHYAGRFLLAPAASWDDGRLDLRLFSGRGRGAALGAAARLFCGIADSRALTRPVERVLFRAPPEAALQVDGDPLRIELPVEVQLAGEPLHVLAPA